MHARLHAGTDAAYCCGVVAFRIYDLDRTGDIQPSEVARLLSALLQNNPDIALDEQSIQKIVEQASRRRLTCCVVGLSMVVVLICSPPASPDLVTRFGTSRSVLSM